MIFLVLARGAICSALALVQFCSWAALGSIFFSDPERREDLPAALLLGSGITGFLYAVIAWRSARAAMLVVLALCALALAWRAPHAWRLLRGFLRDASDGWATRSRRLVLGVGLACLWLLAICPPRDADVMRYHLAHIRQIDIEGSWQPIPEFHYAIPFGWSFNYLPYEHLGYPETAHLLNLLLAVAGSIAISGALGPLVRSTPVFLLFAAVASHPAVVKMATTAFADSYLAFAMACVAAAALRLPASNNAFAVLGFAGWIGLQGRYHAGAIAAASLGVAVAASISTKQWSGMRTYAKWALFALLLAAPFYIFNLVTLGNPFWPLLAGVLKGPSPYADTVVASYARGLGGVWSLPSFVSGIHSLSTELTMFPLGVMALLLPLLAWMKDARIRRSAQLCGLFLLTWAMAQPVLFPRFVLSLVPLFLLGWGAAIARAQVHRAFRLLTTGALATALLTFVAADFIYARDYARYLVSADLAEYHRATLFHDVYEWANQNTPRDSRFLVIVSDSCSYPLKRWHRRADPVASGVCDWEAMRDSRVFADFLRRGNYQYVIYQDTDWHEEIGGAQMQRAIMQGASDGVLRLERTFQVRLVTLRMFEQSEPATVRLYRVQDAAR